MSFWQVRLARSRRRNVHAPVRSWRTSVFADKSKQAAARTIAVRRAADVVCQDCLERPAKDPVDDLIAFDVQRGQLRIGFGLQGADL